MHVIWIISYQVANKEYLYSELDICISRLDRNLKISIRNKLLALQNEQRSFLTAHAVISLAHRFSTSATHQNHPGALKKKKKKKANTSASPQINLNWNFQGWCLGIRIFLKLLKWSSYASRTGTFLCLVQIFTRGGWVSIPKARWTTEAIIYGLGLQPHFPKLKTKWFKFKEHRYCLSFSPPSASLDRVSRSLLYPELTAWS